MISHSLQSVCDLALGDPLTASVLEPRSPSPPSMDQSVNDGTADDRRPMNLYEVLRTEQFSHGSHGRMHQPAAALRMDPDIVAFGSDLVDQRPVDPLHVAI